MLTPSQQAFLRSNPDFADGFPVGLLAYVGHFHDAPKSALVPVAWSDSRYAVGLLKVDITKQGRHFADTFTVVAFDGAPLLISPDSDSQAKLDAFLGPPPDGGSLFDRTVNLIAQGAPFVAGFILLADLASAGTSADTAAGTAGTVGDTTAAGAGGAAAGAGGAAGSAVNSAGSAASNAAADAANSATNSISSIASSVTDAVKSIRDTVAGIITPIADAVHSVTSVVDDINNNLIKPITDPIRNIIQSYDALHKELSRDLHDGFQGLLRVPTDIANALDSIDASMQRGLSQLGVVMAGTLGDVYERTAPKVGATGFADLRELLNTSHKLHTAASEEVNKIHLSDDIDAEKLANGLRNLLTQLRETTGWWSPFVHLIAVLLESLPLAGGFLLAGLESAKEAGRASFQATHLGAGDAINAWDRDMLDDDSVRRELKILGYNDARIAVLLRLSRLQPSIGDALHWWRRGFIDTALRDQLLKEQTVPENHLDLYADASFSPPAYNDVLEELVKAQIASTGLRADTYTSQAPDALRAAALRQGITVEAADAAWRAHWLTLSPPQAVEAFFRSFVSWDQARSLMRAGGLPDEAHELFRDLLRPRLERRAFAQFVKAGVMSLGELEQELRDQGWREIDIVRMMKFLEQLLHPDEPHTVDRLHGLASSTVLQLYGAKTITRDRAESLIERLGAGADAAALQLDLFDLQSQAKVREAQRKRIVASARAGALTLQEAAARLASIGLTAAEIDATVSDIEAMHTAADRQPNEGTLARMVKLSIITDHEFLDAVKREGFSDHWANALLQLALHEPQPKGGATTP